MRCDFNAVLAPGSLGMKGVDPTISCVILSKSDVPQWIPATFDLLPMEEHAIAKLGASPYNHSAQSLKSTVSAAARVLLAVWAALAATFSLFSNEQEMLSCFSVSSVRCE